MAKGPAASYAREVRGHVVNGLYVQKAKSKSGRPIDRFFAYDPEGRRRYFGSSDNRTDAIRRFRKWQGQLRRDTLTLRETPTDASELPSFLEDTFARYDEGDSVTFTIDPDGTITHESIVGTDIFREKVAREIGQNPKLAAQKTGSRSGLISNSSSLRHRRPRYATSATFT